MSVFDLFRGFFGDPGGHYRGRRDPFFDAMTHDDDDDDDDEDAFRYEGFRGDQQGPSDGPWRFGFSVGPGGMRIQEPPVFGGVFREMEEIFSELGPYGVPAPPPPPEDGAERGGGGSGGNPLRDFMFKSDDDPKAGPSRGPRYDGPPSHESPEIPGSPFHSWAPFSKFNDIWKKGPQKGQRDDCKGDGDLDSAVSSGGLDQILVPNQPRVRSFFQSVTVTKVVKPDGTVEERRTVRDGQGKEETTVTQSGGPGVLEGPDRPTGGQHPYSDLRDEDALFSKLFGGFK
ncbi:HCLS1-associated protein X-1 isoform X2 [Brachionichthys hirsutus]|uniref:HCLS1-associated protein X-1 isoform X2 n=1 Tax=Brachionichthys hirsutus TaxID=412623 RepID=UPI003605031C